MQIPISLKFSEIIVINPSPFGCILYFQTEHPSKLLIVSLSAEQRYSN